MNFVVFCMFLWILQIYLHFTALRLHAVSEVLSIINSWKIFSVNVCKILWLLGYNIQTAIRIVIIMEPPTKNQMSFRTKTMISLHLKITRRLHRWRDLHCNGYMINCSFHSEKRKRTGLVFHCNVLFNRTLHGRL